MDPHSLIHRYLVGEATESEVAELNRILASDAQLRREYARVAAMDAALRETSFERASEPATTLPTPTEKPMWKLLFAVALAACVLAAVMLREQIIGASGVATLASSENAAWESSLPTMPGSDLAPGLMKLVAGIATIRFQSGAEVMIEAPANLVLISPMRCKLLDGAAVVSVPEPAIGFVLETPQGYVVDHGTQFALSVGGEGKPSEFEVIDGEISVHLAATGQNVRLTEMQSASISGQKLTSFDGQIPERVMEASPVVQRIGTDGRATSVIRNNKRRKRHFPDLLMVKRGNSGSWDQRAMFSFDTAGVDFAAVESVRLRLNLVPSGLGFATRLPIVNRFAVYGLTNAAKREWKIESLWEDSPGPEDGQLLGTFEIARSLQRGSFGVENEALLQFLSVQEPGRVTFILVRETGQIKGEGPGLVHAFASDLHAEAAGPVLEFSVGEQP